MANLAKEAIRSSFLKLLAEKPFDKITVKDVIDDCQIARRTFYYHYQDLYAVVEEILRLETEKVIREYPSCKTWEEGFIMASQFVLTNRQAVSHLYRSEHREEIIRYVDKVAAEVMDRFLTDAAGDMEVLDDDRRLIGEFYRFALSGMVYHWLDGNMQSDPEQLIRRIGVLFGGNIERALRISAGLEKGRESP